MDAYSVIPRLLSPAAFFPNLGRVGSDQLILRIGSDDLDSYVFAAGKNIPSPTLLSRSMNFSWSVRKKVSAITSMAAGIVEKELDRGIGDDRFFHIWKSKNRKCLG